MKSQDTLAALEDLRSAASDAVPVVCCQNGVANERIALRRFSRVYGMLVDVPATYLEAGVVQTEAKGTAGILDAGCYPAGIDDVVREVIADLSASNFSARPDPHIMRIKYTKLLLNLKNALQALCSRDEEDEIRPIVEMLKQEAVNCYKAAGIEWAAEEELTARRDDHLQIAPVDGKERQGGSSWQSVARGSGTIETDYLNGEIVLLGRLHGIATPANEILQRLSNRLVKEGGRPESRSVDGIRSEIAEHTKKNV
jgi:2-dehydropantoate 2-reductase